MAQMMDKRRMPDIGEAEVYEVDLTDGQVLRVVVTKALRMQMGAADAFNWQLASALRGRNSSVPTRSARSFV